MDSHKSTVLSINLSSVALLQSDSEEGLDLKARLKEMNSSWDRLGKSLKEWRTALQDALMQCQVQTQSTQKVAATQRQRQMS